MSLKKQGGRGTIWTSITKTSTNVLEFAVYALLARILPLEIFGILAVGLLVVEFANSFVNTGVTQNLIQRKEWCNNYVNTSFTVLFGVCSAISLFIALIVSPLVFFYYDKLAGVIVLSLAFLPALTAFEVIYKAKLQRDFKNKQLLKVYVSASFMSSLLIIFLVYSDLGVWSIIIGRYFKIITLLIYMKLSSSVCLSICFHKELAKELWQFVKPLILMSFMIFFQNKANNIFTAAILGPTALAILNVARRCQQVVTDFSIQPINAMVVPVFSRLSTNRSLSEVNANLTGNICFICIPIFLGAGLIAEIVVPLSFGEKFLKSGYFLLLMSFSILPVLLTWMLSNILIAKGYPSTSFRFVLTSTLIITTVSFSTVWFGIEILLFSLIFTNVVLVPIRFYIAKTKIDVSLKKCLQKSLPFYIAGAVMFISVRTLDSHYFSAIGNDFAQLACIMLSGAFIYPATCLSIFRRITLNQLRDLKSMTKG